MTFIIGGKKPFIEIDPTTEGPRLKKLAEEQINDRLGPIYDLTDAENRERYRAVAEGIAEEFFGPEWDISIKFTVGEQFAKVLVNEYLN
jgi:hypothetical protein